MPARSSWKQRSAKALAAQAKPRPVQAAAREPEYAAAACELSARLGSDGVLEKPAASQQSGYLRLPHPQLVPGAEQVFGLDRVPVAPRGVGEPGHVHWLDRGADSIEQPGVVRAGRTPQRLIDAVAKTRPEYGVIAEQERRSRQLRPAEPAGRFGEACRREIEQAEGGEEIKIVEAGIERGDQVFGGHQFHGCAQRVIEQPRRELRGAPRAGDDLREARNPQQRQRKPGG